MEHFLPNVTFILRALKMFFRSFFILVLVFSLEILKIQARVIINPEIYWKNHNFGDNYSMDNSQEEIEIVPENQGNEMIWLHNVTYTVVHK